MLNGKSGPHYWISSPSSPLVKRGRILFEDKIHHELFTFVLPRRTTEILFNLNNLIFVFPCFPHKYSSSQCPQYNYLFFYPAMHI